MNNIALTIKNCNNLDEANIEIQFNKLNIKYGINGTGKSTIVRAIDLASSNQGDLSELLPFKYRENPDEENIPNITELGNIVTVKVFNEAYVNQLLFKPDEVINNSFSIFIKTTEYEQKMVEINDLISGIKDTFNNDDDLDKVIQDLTDLSASFGKSSSGMHGSSKLSKAILKGNLLENIPETLAPYQSFLTLPDNKNVKWLGWHNKGEEFLEVSDDCPYCTSPSSEKKETIRAIKKEYNPKNIEHLNDIMKIMGSLGEYFASETHEKLQEIITNKGRISDEQKTYLEGIRPNIETLRTKLSNLKEISFFSFKDTEKAQDKINDFKISLSYLPHLDSEPSKVINH
jgi:DNA repair exonuclease SbcCD ATPase subunit